MKMIYDVLVSETSYGNVQVEAKDRAEARSKAITAVSEGQAYWGDSECFVDGIKQLDKEGNIV